MGWSLLTSVLKGESPLPLPHSQAKGLSNKSAVMEKDVKELSGQTCNGYPMYTVYRSGLTHGFRLGDFEVKWLGTNFDSATVRSPQ